jgi:two-component system, OmpR family, alkaline phosphatase synthesis response regulator PhoP
VKRRVLIVEDEDALAMLLADRLEAEGYSAAVRADGPSGLEAARSGEFHLVVLDVMLPGMDGFEVCRNLRNAGSQVPVIMLTARGDVADRIAGLRTGADDYVPKPFDAAELLARMEALFRRSATVPGAVVDRFGDVAVDHARRRVTRLGQPVELSLKEFQLLCYLLERPDTPVTRDELLQNVWGYEVTPNTRTVDVHMAQLRQKLEPNPREPRHLVTAHGWGYKFVRNL